MSKTGKRPIRALTAHEKLEAIKRVHDGESKASVARDIGVPESTLRGWCKNETKISYQSRQSSPDTDESYEPKEKRAKVEQPFNLSLSKNMYTPPNSESLYTPLDFSKTDMDSTPKTPQNLSIKNEIPKSTASQMTEREKTRAELARLSVELGLNRPEMFATSSNNASSSTGNNATLADLAANITLLSQWNNMMMQQQLMQNTTQTSKKQQQQQLSHVAAMPESSSSLVAPQSAMKSHSASASAAKLPKEQQSMDEYIKCWLRTQEAILTNQSRGAALPTSNGLPSPPAAAPSSATSMPTSSHNGAAPNNASSSSAYQSSWFWKWYKQLSYNQQTLSSTSSLQQPLPEKPILYQQLTKEGENLSSTIIGDKPSPNSSNNKARSVLDNLLSINNNNNNHQLALSSATAIKREQQNGGGDVLSQSEALEHGEKFMKWLETCSDPSVTAMQIMQFKSLLNNIKNRAEQKNNGDLQHNKTKVKRK